MLWAAHLVVGLTLAAYGLGYLFYGRAGVVIARIHKDPEVCRAVGGAIDADESGRTLCVTPCDMPP